MSELTDGLKETEIGPIPVEWEVVRLGEVCSCKSEITQPEGEGRVRYVGLEHIDSGEPQLRRWGFDTEVRSSKNQFYPGDVLYGKLRPYLDKAALAEFEGICSTDILVFEAYKGRTIPEFLVHVLHTPQLLAWAISTTAGVNHPRTSWGALKRFEFPLPPLPEQRRIAHVLSTIQRAIAAQDDLIAATRKVKRSLMQRLFTYGPGPEPAPTKETEIGEIPEHWEVVRLGEMAQIRYGLGQPPERGENGIPMIRATNIKRGRIVQEGLLRVRSEWIPTSRDPFLRAGDIIVVRSGAYTGDVAMVTSKWEGSIAGYDLVVSPLAQLDSSFCAQYLLSKRVQGYFRSQRDRSAQPHINSHQLSDTLVLLPPLPEQHEIARMFSAVDRKIEVEEQRKAALQALFKAMLHQLMTGQIRLGVGADFYHTPF